MADTKIEWATKVWNPITGCTKISGGCQNCWAFRMSKRLAGRYGYPKDNPFAVTLRPERLEEPLHWKKPQRIFVCSMGDLFHENVPDDFIDEVFATMFLSPQHIFLVLTKRAKRMKKYMDLKTDNREESIGEKIRNRTRGNHSGLIELPFNNIYIGVSVEDQKTADERIPLLLQTTAVNRFVSYEPALGLVNFRNYLYHDDCYDFDCDSLACSMTSIGRALDWLIMGAETSHGSRNMHPDWARKVRDDCKAAGVAFFMKQMSKKASIPEDLMIKESPNG